MRPQVLHPSPFNGRKALTARKVRFQELFDRLALKPLAPAA